MGEAETSRKAPYPCVTPQGGVTRSYPTVVLRENVLSALAQPPGTLARARGMAEIAKASGLARKGLYKALRPGGQPCFETLVKITPCAPASPDEEPWAIPGFSRGHP